jgi:hypothetical protein
VTDIVRTTIDAEIAALVPVQRAGAVTSPYGEDLDCLNDLNTRASNTTGEAQSVIQDAYHRLITQRLPGEDPEEINWGIDLFGYQSKAMTRGKIGMLQAEISNVLLKDERISPIGFQVVVKTSADFKTISITIRGNLASSDKAFAFVATLGSEGVNATILSA